MDPRNKKKGIYDLLLKGGDIIDPSQGLHKVGSVAIRWESWKSFKSATPSER